MILDYHTAKKIKTLIVHDCPLWSNSSIKRQLSNEDVAIVMEEFCKSGHGEWEDEGTKTRCRILWRKPEQLASDIYDWAEKKMALLDLFARSTSCIQAKMLTV
uniref:Uncharacterized protein n=1 Tax=Thalassionema nitzschioides TaxID=33649 RepID=A0A7S1E6Z7_9STRA